MNKKHLKAALVWLFALSVAWLVGYMATQTWQYILFALSFTITYFVVGISLYELGERWRR